MQQPQLNRGVSQISPQFPHFSRSGVINIIKSIGLISGGAAVLFCVRFSVGIITLKLISSSFGPSGMYEIGKFQNIVQILMAIAGSFITTGVIVNVAGTQDSQKTVSTSYFVSFWASIVLGLIIILKSFLFSCELNAGFLVQCFLACSIFFICMNILLSSYLNGCGRYRLYYIQGILCIIISFFLVLVSINFNSLLCLLAGIALSPIFGYLLTIALFPQIRDIIRIKVPRLSDFDPDTFYNLVKYALMGWVSSISVYGSQYFVRYYLADIQSIDVAGQWQACIKLSENYMIAINTTLATFLLPHYSKIKANIKRKDQIFTIMLSVALVFSVIFTSIYFARSWIIKLLLSNGFENVSDLLGVQLLGDFIKVCAWIPGMVLLSWGRTRAYIIVEIFLGISYVACVIPFAMKWGGIGAIYAYTIQSVLYLFIAVLYLKHDSSERTVSMQSS